MTPARVRTLERKRQKVHYCTDIGFSKVVLLPVVQYVKCWMCGNPKTCSKERARDQVTDSDGVEIELV